MQPYSGVAPLMSGGGIRSTQKNSKTAQKNSLLQRVELVATRCSKHCVQKTEKNLLFTALRYAVKR